MRAASWVKVVVSGAVLCIGGPALVYSVMPTQEELFKRYNPELQRRSIENRQKTQEEFDDFACRLKAASKSNQPIWVELERLEEVRRQAAVQAEIDRRKAVDAEAEALRLEIKNSIK